MNEIESEVTFRPRVNMDTPLSAEAAATPAVLKPIVPTLLKPNKPASIVQQFNKNKSTNSKKPLYTRNKKQFGGYYFMQITQQQKLSTKHAQLLLY